MLFHTYLDLSPSSIVYLVLENGNCVLEKSWKCPEKYFNQQCDRAKLENLTLMTAKQYQNN